MQDSDIKKMVLQEIMDEMNKGIGEKYKKPDAAIVVEKHTTAVPLEGGSSDAPMEGDMDHSMESHDESDGRPLPFSKEAFLKRMGVKAKSSGK